MEGAETSCNGAWGRSCHRLHRPTDDWWAAVDGEKSEMWKFRAVIARDEDLLEVVFSNTTTTSECSFVPGVDDVNLETKDLGESLGEDDTTMHSPMQATGSGASAYSSESKRPRFAPLHPSSSRSGKRTECDVQMKCLVDLCERSLQSPSRLFGSSVTSPEKQHAREDLLRLMKLVKEAGADEGSNEHYYASQLVMMPECHDSFLSMEMNEGRLN